jgi:hypothetical protein
VSFEFVVPESEERAALAERLADRNSAPRSAGADEIRIDDPFGIGIVIARPSS